MARRRGPNEKTSYTTAPEIPDELHLRMTIVRAVLGDRMTISEGARALKIARVNMQTLVHRAEAALLATIEPRPTGPAPMPATEKALQAKVAELEKANAKLNRQLLAADDMMMAAGEIIRSLRGLPPTISTALSRRSKRSPRTPKTDDDDEPELPSTEPIIRRALERMTTTSSSTAAAARAVGVGTKTLRRWLARLVAGVPLIRRRGGRMQKGPPASEERVCQTVRDLHGLVGAASLARTVDGVSRRRAGILKRETLAAMESARKRACSRVTITEPGVVRGFDAMHLTAGLALNAADACVPYRTSAVHAPTYDAETVAAVLDADFRIHGAPLVLRDDRARCHTAPPVVSVLRKHGVALLQGPPYHAQYYGQLERQNREHRAWLAWLEHTEYDMQSELGRMKSALNERWLRPRLGWRTAAHLWHSRRSFDDQRAAFLDEVADRAACLRSHSIDDHLAMRLAIEQALTRKGYLRLTPGRKTLCE